MDLEVYRSKYNNLSMEELQKIRRDMSTESVFEFTARSIHESRERVKIKGKPALQPQPLLQVLSVSVHLYDGNENNNSFVIYGKIHAEYLDSGSIILHELYDRDSSDAEIVSPNGNLTLIGPDCVSIRPEYACIPLFRSRIKVMLYDGADSIFAKQCFFLDDEIDVDDYYDCVKTKSIHCELGSLTFKYIAISFGINCRIQAMFSNNDRQVSKKYDFADVSGKVVVRYGNNYGSNYSSEEECVLFEIQENEFKRVEFDEGKMLQLSRCWVTVPAYSSLTIGVNLSDFETKQLILNDSIEFIPQQGWMSSSSFASVSGDIIIRVRVAWFTPKPMGRCKTNRDYHFLPSRPLRGIPGVSTEEVEMMDIESSDDNSSNLNPPWWLHHHGILPLSSPAIEIFSIFIGRESTKAMQIHGLIDVLSDGRGICNIFKRNENDALILPEDVKTLPIPDGSRLFEDFNPLEMKFDIKDAEGCLAIKGYVDWAASVLDSYWWHDKQLCSFIQGLNGFAAIFYSIFSEAIGAYVSVFLEFEVEDADFYPWVCGSIIAEYSRFDYSSRYNKNNFRKILFRKTQNDPIPLGIVSGFPLSRSMVLLSRSMVVVPTYSSLVVDFDLDFEVSYQKFSCAKKIEIEIGEAHKTIETNDYCIRIELNWCEVK